MQNRTPIAAEARPPLPDFTPVPRKYRHDGWTPERQAFRSPCPPDMAAQCGALRT